MYIIELKQIYSFKHYSCHMCLFKDIKITVGQTSSNQGWNIAGQDLQCHRRENHSSKPLGDTVICCALRTSFVSLCAKSLCIVSCATFSHPLSQLNLKYQGEVLRTTYPILHTACLVPRTSYLVPRTLHLIPRTSYLIPRTTYLVHNSRPTKGIVYTLFKIWEWGTDAVQVYWAPRHPTLRWSSNPTCVWIACMYVQSETSFCFLLLLLFVKITAGDILQPPSATPLAGGPIQPAVCHMYKNYVFVIHLRPRVTCTMHPAPRTLYLVPHVPYPVPRTSHLVPRTPHPVSRTSHLVLCTSSSAPSTS